MNTSENSELWDTKRMVAAAGIHIEIIEDQDLL